MSNELVNLMKGALAFVIFMIGIVLLNLLPERVLRFLERHLSSHLGGESDR